MAFNAFIYLSIINEFVPRPLIKLTQFLNMAVSLESREGRSVLAALAKSSREDGQSVPEAGRDVVGSLGFRLVSWARQMFQSPSQYQAWLNEQRARVTKQFISICQRESSSSAGKSGRILVDQDIANKHSLIKQESLDLLKAQSSKGARLKVYSPAEFEKALVPITSESKKQYSGFQALLNFINPFDDEQSNEDWMSQLRASGQALKIEMTELLGKRYDLLESHWRPEEIHAWAQVGARILQINEELCRLCQSAEELVLRGLAKPAGFNLAILFSLLKALSIEYSVVTYLIAHPESAQTAKNWGDAINILEARG